jgi:MoaA/NifB/PqqE/SkfB family radical SAM enzyme
MNPASYSIANEFPVKLLHQEFCRFGKILPIHLRVCVTNKCNENCPWCEFGNVDRRAELSLAEIRQILKFFRERGTKAVSITGGGEPTCHPDYLEIIAEAMRLELKIGLETNGKLIIGGKVPFLPVAWTRLSITDVTSGKYPVANIEQFAKLAAPFPFGVAFTVPGNVSVDTAREVAKVCEDIPTCTHIRYAQEFGAPDKTSMLAVMESAGAVSTKSIFSWRDECPPGYEQCRAGMLRPFIGADGNLYPCNSVQILRAGAQRDNPQDCSLGHWIQFDKMEPFDGRKCARCFYGHINETLAMATDKPEHLEFV